MERTSENASRRSSSSASDIWRNLKCLANVAYSLYQKVKGEADEPSSSSSFSSSAPNFIAAPNAPPADIPAWLSREMARRDGTHVSYLFSKKLRKSDVHRQQSRLLIPMEGAVKILGMLTREEKQKVKCQGLLVKVVGSHGLEHSLSLKFYDTAATYRFISGWNNIIQAYNLRPDVHQVCLWGFRVMGEFWLGIDHASII